MADSLGRYKFNATVMGNTEEKISGTPCEAVVLWESSGTSKAVSDGDFIYEVFYSDGYIYFTTSDKAGNAVIALKDKDGTILWSWHIWLTGVGIWGRTEWDCPSGFTVMDRNLGAIVSDAREEGSNGLYYQWGKKDPFISRYSSSATISLPTSYVTIDDPSVDFLAKNPTVFINVPRKINSDYWNEDKGIFDPCPPGWQVPKGGEDGVWAHFEDYSYSLYGGRGIIGCFGHAAHMYPAAGYLDHGEDWSLFGRNLYMSYNNSYDMNYCLEFNNYNDDDDDEVDVYYDRAQDMTDKATPIRCMREDY